MHFRTIWDRCGESLENKYHTLRNGKRCGKWKIYFQPRDLWLGVFISDEYLYILPFPTLVFRRDRW